MHQDSPWQPKAAAPTPTWLTGAGTYALDGLYKNKGAQGTIGLDANDAITGEAMANIKQGEAAVILVAMDFESNNPRVAMGERVKLENIDTTDGSESADMPVAPTYPAVPDGAVPIGFLFVGNVGSGSTTGDYVPGTTNLNRGGLATQVGSLAGVLTGRAPVTDVPAIAT